MAFKTFVVGEVATASDVNTYLMKQAVIQCTSGTRPSSPVEAMTIYETDTDLLRIWTGAAWETFGSRTAEGVVNTLETTASTSYTDLATSGPAVTINTGTQAEVTIGSYITNGAATPTYMSFAVSGASTIAANDNLAINNGTTTNISVGRTFLVTGLTPGSNIFTAKYRVVSNTGTWASRRILVRPA